MDCEKESESNMSKTTQTWGEQAKYTQKALDSLSREWNQGLLAVRNNSSNY